MAEFTPIEDHEALCDQVDDIIKALESQSDTNRALNAALEAMDVFNKRVVSASKIMHSACVARDNALAVVIVSLARLFVRNGVAWEAVHAELLKSKKFLPSDAEPDAAKLIDTIAHTFRYLETP